MKLALASLILPALLGLVIVCPPVGLVSCVAFLTYLKWKRS